VHRLEKWKTKKRFPTFPPGARDDDDDFFAEPKTKERKSAAPRPPHSPNRLSLQSSKTDFMLIFQLENAYSSTLSVKRVAETRPPMITMLGLLPMALSKGIGSEVQNPLAVTSDPSSAASVASRSCARNALK